MAGHFFVAALFALQCQVVACGSCSGNCSCSHVGLECGVNICDESCGVCGTCPNSFICLAAAGRCAPSLSSGTFDSDSDMSTKDVVATGMACKDKYCRRVSVYSIGILVDPTTTRKSGWISDNVRRKYLWNDKTDATSAVCPMGTVVTYVKCRGKHCDDLQLSCAKPEGWVRGERIWTVADWFSDTSDPPSQSCPSGFGMIGLACKEGGRYCHSKKILCGELVPSAIGARQRESQVLRSWKSRNRAMRRAFLLQLRSFIFWVFLVFLVTAFVLICWATLK